ncbi:MAG: delta-lactam-biosynthetic de-N-acetylase [Clostridiaceae bacterium]|nr:delta-lactam-biosynthetic de-N-acetylase [Clostridiaceae bacterium]
MEVPRFELEEKNSETKEKSDLPEQKQDERKDEDVPKDEYEPRDVYENEQKDEYRNEKKDEQKKEQQLETIEDVQKNDSSDNAQRNLLNNKKYGWGYKKQKNLPPIVSQATIDLLEKYDAIYRKNTDEKVLFLTFDEGYENGYTPVILDVLKEHQVPAAFFITGPYLKKNPDLVKRMVEEGHIVGNHTVNHPSMPEVLDDAKLEEELLGLDRSFYEMFQSNMKYVRPPKGEYSERTLALTQSLGYKTVFWSFAYVDWDVNNQKGADYAYQQVMDGIHNGAILLLHAVSKDNAEALGKIIQDARAAGYQFKSLDEF